MLNPEIGFYIFRKDFRIKDNRGLIKLSEKVKFIIPIFIFDINQIDLNINNKTYLSFPAVRFLCESIIDLDEQIKNENGNLYIFYGKPHNVVKYIINFLAKINFTKKYCFGLNEDYTKYSIERDDKINEICYSYDINIYYNNDDYTLYDLDLLLRDENNKMPYKQYGAFKKNMLINKSKFNKVDNKKIKFYPKKINFDKSININEINSFWDENLDENYKPAEIGGRQEGLLKLSKLGNFKEYNTKRDNLDYETTRMSAYLNFGCISEREFYEKIIEKINNNSQLINQIIWRDYYLSLLKFLPDANSYDVHVDKRFEKLKWLNYYTKTNFKTKRHQQSYDEWKLMMNSQTGFLIIDAAVKEILETGFMHNRCRMIVGVFSVKYLLINPLCRYYGLHDWFSRHLLDCSTSQNKLNAQWVTELDFPGKKFAPSASVIAGRPMTISNIVIKKWDPECTYIKKWLPHLKDVPNKILYNWDTKYDEKLHVKPIFDAKERYQEWIQLCKN
jgi:deoxyribodipyrimidine photo-lyase